MKTEELKAMCEKCTHKNPCAVCLVNAHIQDAKRGKVPVPATCGECEDFNGGDCCICCHPPVRSEQVPPWWCPKKEDEDDVAGSESRT